MLDQPAGRGTILLVEDEPFVALVAQQVLEDHGFTVTVAAHGRAALEHSGNSAGQALLLAVVDMGLPDMSGGDVVRALRGLLPHLPVIVATGYAAEEVEGELAGLDKVVVIRKPYDVRTLRATLRGFDIDMPED